MTEPDAEFVRKREEWKRDRSTSMFYCLIGPRGSVAFQYFPTAPAGLEDKIGDLYPMAIDLGHSPLPIYDGQTARQEDCPYLPATLKDRLCYYDGSSLNAEHPMRLLLTDGEDALWHYLREYYADVFESEEFVVGFSQLLQLMAGQPGEKPCG